MRKIILAIIAVFCLQLTFQVYSAIDRGDDEYVAMNAGDPVSGLPVEETEAAEIPEGDIAPGWWFGAASERRRPASYFIHRPRTEPTLVAINRTERKPRHENIKDTL